MTVLPEESTRKFSTPCDPAQLTAFINLRVLTPEHQHWRRGIEAAGIYPRPLPHSRMSGDGEIVQNRTSADRRRDELEAADATNFT
ncbi:hypothetical protein [Streptomyces sp. WAC 04229]|uniref:hypothetical protein n=1 Tax=Streptomyces sp. WAC 04229 TaxID=2203206 RepID=UPI003D70BFFD